MTTASAITLVQIEQLVDLAPLDGTEQLPVQRAGVTGQVDMDAVAAFLGGAASGAITWTGVATATLAVGVTNDLGTDISAASRLALDLAGDAELRGLDGGEDGKIISITNRDPAFTLTIITEGATSAAENRFASNGDVIVPPFCGALFLYDGTIQRWVKQ